MSPERRIVRFPEGFQWGTATAAYQIEGAAAVDGRRPSVWDSYLPVRGYRGDTGDIAVDHYHRWQKDLELLQRLGAPSYRFSISWSRVVRDDGTPNPTGLDFYRRLVDGLLERGIRPAATMYHLDLPARFERGWVDRDTALHFAEYAQLITGEFGDRVPMWMTVNEVFYEAWLGYGEGVFPPGGRDSADAVAALHHLLLAHGLGVDAVRANAPHAEAGLATGYAPIRPGTAHPADVEAARIADLHVNGSVLGPILLDGYPEEYLEHPARREALARVVREGDAERIARPIDFLGVNYYFTRHMIASERAEDGSVRLELDVLDGWHRLGHLEQIGVTEVRPRSDQPTILGWTPDAAGLEDALVEVAKRYGNPPIHVTENGLPLADYADPRGEIHDLERIEYLRDHLVSVGRAIESGADVRGYYVWSLLDNLEWTSGYAPRFGLVYVDLPTQRRTPKDSFHWYASVVSANAVRVPTRLGASSTDHPTP